ncbi:glycosyltransferase family 2 protein [Breoghania sp. L-A4]|uniref:glycosyltransferase family 2 protein n=1 Tax=Breoghania sp. L-A4 TaxID=2304600 RepID=UPI003204C486
MPSPATSAAAPLAASPHGTPEDASRRHSIAVLLPCYNEAETIAPTIAGFAQALPGARIYVYDNNSADETAAKAQAAGASVHREHLQGKGNVVRRMLADIDADIYLIADGDMTYDPKAASLLIQTLVANNLDMTVGVRQTDESEAYRRGHRFGNRTFNHIVRGLFGPASPTSSPATGRCRGASRNPSP